MSNQARNITLNTTKKLYALSGNRCANPDCHRELFKNGVQLGEIAHIKAASPNGPRYDASMTDDERRDYANLILLCGDCNKIIDGNPQKYPVELLYDWKRNHESFYQEGFDNKLNEYLTRLGKCQERNVGVEDDFFFDIKLTIGDRYELCKKHVLSEYILKQIEQCEWKNFRNLFVKGVAGIGKSTEMKYAYNCLIKVFSEKNNHQKYQFSPYPIYYELKNFQDDLTFETDVENTIVFLDGFDELSEKNALTVQKKIESLKSILPNVRFVISGREASFHDDFISGNHNEVLKLFYDINLNDENDRKLYYRYLNTPLSSLVFIPLYKQRALQDEYKDVKNYKQFIESIIEENLRDDKKRKDCADGITNWQPSLSKIDLEKLKKALSFFCFQLYSKEFRFFSEKDVRTHLDNDEFIQCFLKSSLIEEQEGKLSFVSNLYYEYFLALYFSTQNFSVVRKNLFLSNGKVRAQNIVVISMLLNILDYKNGLYTKVVWQLSQQSSTYVLLTDYTALSPEKRFDFYKKILKEYNDKKSHIYYLRFHSSHNLLANIGSLSDSLIDLLPEEYKSDAIALHKKQIECFLRNLQKNNLVVFANSIILLGMYNRKIWGEEQQIVLKSLSIPVIRFFLNNSLAKELDGFLSFEVVLYWYLEYGWADYFSTDDWRSFLVQILPCTPEDFYTIGNESDFRVKLEIFNLFHKFPIVSKIFRTLSIRVLNTKFDNGSAGIIPDKIPDDYEGHVIHVNRSVTSFGEYLKEIDVTCYDILEVFNEASMEDHIYKIHSTERDAVLESLWKLLNKCAPLYEEKQVDALFHFIKRYLDDGQYMFHDQINNFCSKLNTKVKIALLDKILKDEQFVVGENSWHHLSAVITLLNNDNEIFSKNALKKIGNLSYPNYQSIVTNIAYKNDSHCLKDFCSEILPKVNSPFVETEKKRNSAIEKFETDKRLMLANEINIICDKEKLLAEINRVSSYVDRTISSGNYRSAWDVLHEMNVESIEHAIRWPYRKKHIRDVFSTFVVDFLKRRQFLNDKCINKDAVKKEVKACFASEVVFWRYVYIYCIAEKKDENVRRLVSANADFVERIKKSMESEIVEILKQSPDGLFNKAERSDWMVPFLYFSALFYDLNIPDWFDKNKVTKLVICASVYEYFHQSKSELFPYKSIFEWLQIKASLSNVQIVNTSIKCYEVVDDPSIKSKVIYFLVDVDDAEAVNFVIGQTKVELENEKQRHEVLYALAHYWRSVKFDKTDEIGSFIPFEKFLNKPEESSRDLIDAMIDYFCENASTEQKMKAAKKIQTLEGLQKQELLRKLGDENAIACAIDEYLAGANVASDGFNGTLYNLTISDDKLFIKFIDLYEYSLGNSKERRRILGNWALQVIKENISVERYEIFKKRIEKIIKKRRNDGDHWEGLQDVLDEIEQDLYENESNASKTFFAKLKNLMFFKWFF